MILALEESSFLRACQEALNREDKERVLEEERLLREAEDLEALYTIDQDNTICFM